MPAARRRACEPGFTAAVHARAALRAIGRVTASSSQVSPMSTGPKVRMRLAGDEPKAGALVDVPRRDQDALRPQRHPAIAGRAGEADAFLGQPRADAEPARLGVDDQQPQLGDLVGRAHHEHRADRLAVDLGDPAVLAGGIEILQEGGDDLGHEAPRTRCPSRIPRRRALPCRLDHPAHVAGPVRPQEIGRLVMRGRRQQPFRSCVMAATTRAWSAAASLSSIAATSCCERLLQRREGLGAARR